MRISDTQAEHLLKHGYVIVPHFLTAAELSAARENMFRYYPSAEELSATPERYGGIHEEPESLQNEFPFAGDTLNHISTHPELIAFVEKVLGTRDVLLSQAAIWAKYAGTGDFEQGLHLDYQGNTLVVSAFTTNGSIGTGAGSGSFSGSLAGSLTLNSATNFFNEWLQPVVFGTRLSFNFALSEQYTSGTPDNFSFYLLNSTGQPLGSTDPTGSGAAFSADIRATTVPAVFTSPSFAVSLVPEPQSWLLWATALACGAALRRAPRR